MCTYCMCVYVCSERSPAPLSLQIQTRSEADGENPGESRGHRCSRGYASHRHHQFHSDVEMSFSGLGASLCYLCRQCGLPGPALHGVCAAARGGSAGVGPGGSCPCEVPLPPAGPTYRQH